MPKKLGRGGFTLVELLVVIAIIGILVALLLPAIQAAREAARRTECNNNLKNVTLGLQNYHDTYKVFPSGAMHAGPRPASAPAGTKAKPGPSWQYGILPFLEQRNIYDKIASTQRMGAVVGPNGGIFGALDVNTVLGGGTAGNGPLNTLVPDYMRCPSSPLPMMAEQSGSILLPSYVGISGGTDINPTDSTLYPNQAWGIPNSTQIYRNRYQQTISVVTTSGPGGQNCVFTNSGMLPINEAVNMAWCTDGTSNTMIVSEQSDWLRDVNPSISTTYHGDPGWYGPGGPSAPGVGTDLVGGWLTGTNEVNAMPAGAAFVCDQGAFNVTTVRYKPDLKRVLGATPAPGCAELMGHNNPLQSPHPGGILAAFVDGSVQFISGTTDLAVLLRIAIREDGQNVTFD